MMRGMNAATPNRAPDLDAHRSAPTYASVRAATTALIAPLTPEGCQVQSFPDASPAKWHLAHTTWFFETFVLERCEVAFKPFDAHFRVLFNSYYQGVGDQFPRARRGLMTHPTLDEVLRYRAQVDARMQDLLRGALDAETRALVALGLQHEQQHQELLLTDIQHALWCSPGHAAYAPRPPAAAGHLPPLRWFGFAEGLQWIGHDPAQDGSFCFDNETPRHRVWLEAFEIASRPVSNGEILAFIDDGGYRRPELWLSMGWDWVRAGSREAPLYWQRVDSNRWQHHTLQGTLDVDLRAPACHLSYFEADAVARRAGARLPTEAEWEHAARSLPSPAAVYRTANFADLGAFHPRPQVEAAEAPVQMFGDVWEWTQSNYNPYPGYRPLPGAVGEYNGKFMCNQFVLRGGSCATPAGHARASYRNFFPPEAQWQFSGVRLARDAA